MKVLGSSQCKTGNPQYSEASPIDLRNVWETRYKYDNKIHSKIGWKTFKDKLQPYVNRKT